MMIIRLVMVFLVACGCEVTRDTRKENIEASNWKEVERIVDERVGTSKEGVLFFVDVDNVLTFTDHPCTYPNNVKEHCGSFKGKSAQEINDAWGRVFMNNPQKTIDGFAPVLIRDWQTKGGKVLGLTSLVAGEDNTVFLRRAWNLQSTFGVLPSYELLHKVVPGHLVLSLACATTNGDKVSKGVAICEILPLLKSKPKAIVFIDDSEKNLESARKEIPGDYHVITIHYTGYKTQIPQAQVTREQFEDFWKQYFPPQK
ncbi:MAG: DUF2608 domain-containing protein [Holosporales bacterium]|jgi:hypothetical protein|nr:DUF2608 domain-containing protein [Holosporales bacterium]